MTINIPDKFYKLLILVGLISIAFGFYGIDKSEREYFNEIDSNRKISDTIELSKMRLGNERESLIHIARVLSKTHDVDNPITENDSVLTFNRILTGEKNSLVVSDSIQILWLKYRENQFKLELLRKRKLRADNYLNDEKSLKDSYINNYVEFRDFGFALFFVGILIWMFEMPFGAMKKKTVKLNDRIYPHCQSCGVDFNSMRTYGTNKDKTENLAFCKKCYKRGKFTNPKLTKEEFTQAYQDKIKDKSWVIRKIIEYRMENLERWQK